MIFPLIGLLFISLAFAEECATDGAPEVPNGELANTLCLFSKPLIIGASVSAGYGTSTGGPAAILSRELNPSTEIKNIAFNGASSGYFTGAPKEKPSVVMGFDMFFWDTVLSHCEGDYEKGTRVFFKRFERMKVPMIIGKIPTTAAFPIGVRLAAGRPCTAKINRLIDELCTIEKNCIIYDPATCLNSMRSPSGYFIDQVHPNAEGNEFCARDFIRRASYKRLSCQPD